MKVIGETERMNIVLDTETEEIEVTQTWAYFFRPYPKTLGTAPELDHKHQAFFKAKVQRLIQRLWDNKVGLKLVRTKNPEFRPYVGTVFNIRICIQEVSMERAAQWLVGVVNVPAGAPSEGMVQWPNRTISITTEATKNVLQPDRDGRNIRQIAAVHEFGHAFGNASALHSIGMTADEYHKSSPHFSDIDSVMNSGNSVRERHYEYIRHVLELIMPGSVFKTTLLTKQ